MVTTSPDNLWSPNATDPYNLTTDLATMQTSVQAALTNRPKSYRTDLTDAQRLALSGADLFDGLTVFTSDTKLEWKYVGGTWRITGGDTTYVVLKRTATPLSTSEPNKYLKLSTDAAWSASSGVIRSATFSNNEITVQTPGWYEVNWALFSGGSGGGIVGIAVNASGTPTGDALHALSVVPFSIVAAGTGRSLVRLSAGDKLTLWVYGISTNFTVQTPSTSQWGARWVSA